MFWIPRAKQTIKAHAYKCVKCIKYEYKEITQQMAYLPAAKAQVSKPFTHVGIDYACPIAIKLSKILGAKTYKGYFIIFVCF